MELDEKDQRLTLKVVYYGPAMSGKTTNLLRLHDLLSLEAKGDLVVLDTHEDRTLFFDLLPLFFVTARGLRIKLKVYTVPGQVRYDATRKSVLSRADGVVFVADSSRSQQLNNAENFANLEANCQALGIDLEKLPLVVQYNKRDLPDVVSEEEARQRWASAGVSVVFASALNGVGVLETFSTLLRGTYRAIAPQFKLAEVHDLPEEAFLQKVGCPHG